MATAGGPENPDLTERPAQPLADCGNARPRALPVRIFSGGSPARLDESGIGRRWAASPILTPRCVRFGATAPIVVPRQRNPVAGSQFQPAIDARQLHGADRSSRHAAAGLQRLVLDRLRARDTTMRDFFDMFNHRMISLFYQAWEKYRFTVPYERGERNRFSHHVMALLGLGTPGLQNRQEVPDDALVFYSGMLSSHSRSAAALRQLLADYFGVAVEIEQFVGAWYPVDAGRAVLPGRRIERTPSGWASGPWWATRSGISNRGSASVSVR